MWTAPVCTSTTLAGIRQDMLVQLDMQAVLVILVQLVIRVALVILGQQVILEAQVILEVWVTLVVGDTQDQQATLEVQVQDIPVVVLPAHLPPQHHWDQYMHALPATATPAWVAVLVIPHRLAAITWPWDVVH